MKRLSPLVVIAIVTASGSTVVSAQSDGMTYPQKKSPVSASREEDASLHQASHERVVEHEVTAGRGRVPFASEFHFLVGDGSFFLRLGRCDGIAHVPHRYVIRELPPDCTVAVAFDWWQDDGQEILRKQVSPQRDIGIDRWKLSWRTRGKEPVFESDQDGTSAVVPIRDVATGKQWVTIADAVYELTISTTKANQRPKGEAEARDKFGVILICFCSPEDPIKPDTRPKGKRVVDHGVFSRKNISVNWFQWKTPVGKCDLDLGTADVEEGVVHRYHISGLPPEYTFHLGFGVRSTDPFIRDPEGYVQRREPPTEERKGASCSLPTGELLNQTGARRIHIHLATTDGVVLISDEFDTTKAFGTTFPLYESARHGVNGFVSEGGQDGSVPRRANTAIGCDFRARKDARYLLEITIIRVEDSAKRREPLRPIIRS